MKVFYRFPRSRRFFRFLNNEAIFSVLLSLVLLSVMGSALIFVLFGLTLLLLVFEFFRVPSVLIHVASLWLLIASAALVLFEFLALVLNF